MRLAIVLLLVLAGCPSKKAKTPEGGSGSAVRIEPGSGSDAGSSEPPKPTVDPFCANRPEKAGPFVLDAAQAAQRNGTTAKTYVDADSSRERPIETCGIPAARDWMDRTKCPDGSAAEQLGRVGGVGRGGRCNNLIDKYKVRCPGGAIDVYLDVLFCGPGESM